MLGELPNEQKKKARDKGSGEGEKIIQRCKWAGLKAGIFPAMSRVMKIWEALWMIVHMILKKLSRIFLKAFRLPGSFQKALKEFVKP